MGATEVSRGASIQPCTHGSSQGREVRDPHQLLRGHRLLSGLPGAPGGLPWPGAPPVASTPVPHPAAPCQPVPGGTRPAAAPKHTQTSHPVLGLCSVASSPPLRWVEDRPRPHLRLPQRCSEPPSPRHLPGLSPAQPTASFPALPPRRSAAGDLGVCQGCGQQGRPGPHGWYALTARPRGKGCSRRAGCWRASAHSLRHTPNPTCKARRGPVAPPPRARRTRWAPRPPAPPGPTACPTARARRSGMPRGGGNKSGRAGWNRSVKKRLLRALSGASERGHI